MALDVAALQSLYGAKTHNNGNTTYTFGNYIDQVSVCDSMSQKTDTQSQTKGQRVTRSDTLEGVLSNCPNDVGASPTAEGYG